MYRKSTPVRSLLLALAMAATQHAHAAKATEEEMARSALESELRSTDPAVIRRALDEAHAHLRSQVAQRTQDVVGATVVFARGMTATDLEKWAQRHRLELSRVEAKVPVGDDGRVVTMSVGARDLLLLDGSVSERLQKASGSQQYRMMRMADRVEGEENVEVNT